MRARLMLRAARTSGEWTRPCTGSTGECMLPRYVSKRNTSRRVHGQKCRDVLSRAVSVDSRLGLEQENEWRTKMMLSELDAQRRGDTATTTARRSRDRKTARKSGDRKRRGRVGIGATRNSMEGP